MKKTLYVSDLDGTLLTSERLVSDFSCRTINRLVEKGMMFSYATARSLSTARKVTAGLTAGFPLIVYNGVMIVDNADGSVIMKNTFSSGDSHALLTELLDKDFSPMVYSFIDGSEKFSYQKDKLNKATADFISTRKGDPRDRPVSSISELFDGDMYYFNVIDEREKLTPLYEKYKNIFHCVFSSDIYTGEHWLEIMPHGTSKANAARRLADMLGCGRIVAFGDGKNDIDLFESSDECYAVANAVDELKAKATAVIASNDDDAVAKWLLENT